MGEKIRRFYTTWLAPGHGTGMDNPRPATIGTLFLVLFNWGFFYVLVPYTTISNKELFWAGFFAWLVPPSVAAWVVRNTTRESARRIYGRLITGLGIAIIVVYSISLRDEGWNPILFASWPGVLNGIVIGADLNFLWKSHKERKK